MKRRFKYIIETVCCMLRKLQHHFCLPCRKEPAFIHNPLTTTRSDAGIAVNSLQLKGCNTVFVITPLTIHILGKNNLDRLRGLSNLLPFLLR
jgi:hypothetical protein